MKRWFVFLACLCLCLPPALPADDQTGRSEDGSGRPVPFRLASGYLIEIEGRIGDQTHLKFILDTGATISMVGQRIAGKLGLDAHTAQSFSFDRNVKWETATLPEVQFGPVRAANVVVLVGDLARYSEFAGKADGIIGMDLLNLRNVTIDFDAGNLIFEPAGTQTYAPGGDPMTKCLVVEFQIQDRPVRLIVDTGLQGMLLYEERVRRSIPGLRTAGSIKNATMGGRMQVKQAFVPDVVFGKWSREVPVLFVPAPAAEMLPGIDGVVGISVLQARRVRFDFSGKRVSWE